MADDPSTVEQGYSSRSEGNRWLLAVTFAALLIASASHIASYFGFVVIQSRALQNLLTWLLAPLAIWQILIGSAENQIPRPWWTLMGVAWVYATLLGQFLPVGHIHPWARTLRWFGLVDLDPLVLQARTSSASHVAAALSLFLILWYRPRAGAASLKDTSFSCSPLMRRLAAFGIALPIGILLLWNVFRDQNWGADKIGWIGIIALFWLIAGMIVTGIYVLRGALRRDT